MKITKDTTFAEIMQEEPEKIEELAEMGLFCGGCPMAAFETIEMGAAGHGMEVEEILKKLNRDTKKND